MSRHLAVSLACIRPNKGDYADDTAGQGLTAAVAALLALSAGPEVRVPRNPFGEDLAPRGAVAPQPAAAAGVAVESGDVFPPIPGEVAGVSPGAGYQWVPGYYSWTASHGGHHWTWFRGHYENPPQHGAVWMAPHIENTGLSHVYVGGYWRLR